jgi:hypothetical protein
LLLRSQRTDRAGQDQERKESSHRQRVACLYPISPPHARHFRYGKTSAGGGYNS